MKKITLILLSIVFTISWVSAQESNKSDTKPLKLSKLETEIIQSDGYAYAEAACRYNLSKMKFDKDRQNKSLEIEMDNNKLLLYEVMNRGAEKYRMISLNEIYMNAFKDGNIKLNTCVRSNKLQTQNENEKNLKK